MSINLNEVQRRYTNEVVRPMIESLIRFRYELDAFVLEADNQQYPIANVAEDLNDGDNGTIPRSDAPVLKANNITQLRNFASGMRDQINVASLNALVALAVRDVQNIVRS